MNILSFTIMKNMKNEYNVLFCFYTDLLWFPTDTDHGKFKKDKLNHNCNPKDVECRSKRFRIAERILKRLDR